MTTLHVQASQKIDAIEAELRRIGQWQEEQLPASALDFHEAFGSDKLTYFQWLQFVLVPRVREIVTSGDEFPQGSSVGAYAVRELDGHPDVGLLVTLLSEFDALFDGSEFEGIEDERAADADEGSVAAREMAAMGATGPADDAVLAVRGFLIGIQVGNPAASRARLTRPQRDDDTFVPQQPFEIVTSRRARRSRCTTASWCARRSRAWRRTAVRQPRSCRSSSSRRTANGAST